ncbi:MAG: hypothetical protein KBC69_01460 [Candidatus Magasanikbacteria bacterium]|nr:hypothetical protein [Candidatus Magasanikbacteria bacterium]
MRYTKILIFTCGSLVLLILLIWVCISVYFTWQGHIFEKKIEEFQAGLSKPYRDDVYGGQTPQETWNLFLSALHTNDIDLASKYFVLEKQASWKHIIEDTIREKGAIDIASLQNITFDSQTENTAYYYRLINENGKQINSSVIFILNPYNKIWKISLL